ncbi:reductase, leaf isozyme 2, chloroplastic [Seminavis robusta]|uniref:ferredoxin--NADP(+) reductase n=1 Tax=Seminavis robusta TaxID=568900 RepID=A0A9N8HNE2_9STRA|nr:reductase, leaf isozyme 2, chloroplastic [Seminavis robusta]|eukprot:Sro980_g227370.1 reductase, leaf isozyme 2, chloroplastic (428) ;mRNA; f:12798-14329
MTRLPSHLLAVATLSLCGQAWAFTTPRAPTRQLLSSLAAVPVTNEHVLSNGGGVPVVAAGGNSLFDPNEAGKLGDTDICLERIQQGSSYQFLTSTSEPAMEAPPPGVDVVDAQHWLEDIDLPLNFAKPQKPAIATVLGRQRIITADAPGDIQHVVLKLPEGMHYFEGQSLSVIPPGLNEKGRPHKPRLYSIASTRYGDLLDGKTVCLCVRRAEFVDPITGQVDPAKQGVCSNFLCNAEPGTQVQVAGPVGKTMLLPESPDTDIIMVATGTGIAPFRGFLHRLFMENTVARHMFSGKAWLILGVPVTGGLLYADEFKYMEYNAATGAASGELEVDYAISREMKNAQGGKYYVQDALAERADELFNRLENGAHIYFCGLKGMMPGILSALEEVAASKGIVWADKLKELKSKVQIFHRIVVDQRGLLGGG